MQINLLFLFSKRTFTIIGSTNYPYSGEYGGMTMQGIRSFDNQRVGISLTYKFGNQQIKSRRRRGGLDDELNRIAD